MDVDSNILSSIEEENDNNQSSTPPDRSLNQKFHIGALTGNLNVLQELVTKAHLPIDCRDKENSTALLLSCARGHYSVT